MAVTGTTGPGVQGEASDPSSAGGSAGRLVRLGFIGCGGNARGHMGRLRQLPTVKVAAVCDVVEDLARQAAAELGATAYTDHHALLDRETLDAVYLSLPVFAHGQPEMEVIARGLPFLVEKPVAREMATAKEIEARVREKNLMTAVGYQLRYAGTAVRAKQILEGQRLGLFVGRYWCDSGVGDPTRWLRQMARSGGQLVEQATHTIDLMRYLGGEIDEVYCASARRVLKEIDCPDFNAVSLRFADGALGSLSTSWASAIGWSQANILEILFEDARMTWTYGQLSVQRGEKVEQESLPGGDIDEIFTRAVRTGDSSLIRSPYSDAVRSLAVSLAMNLSAIEDRPVRVAELLE